MTAYNDRRSDVSNCQMRVMVTKNVHNPYPGGPTSYTTDNPCLKKARNFYHVVYSRLDVHRQHETKMDDIFGFCDSCNTSQATVPKFYTYDRVRFIRGTVKFVEKVIVTREDVRDDTKKTRLDVIKSGIIRQMSQKNMRDLSPDDWREVFNSAVEEFIVSGVQNS